MKSKTPKLVLSFLMTKTNINEVPEAVSIAKDIGINDMVTANLDYTPTRTQEDLEAFSCNKADGSFKEYIETAREKAVAINLPFRIYPLEMEEVVMCELNPLQILFISYDGCVSPCVYLNMTKKGSMPRIFCGSHDEVQRLCFGNISESDFMEIWDSEKFKVFRMAYRNRMDILEKSNMSLVPGSMDIEEVAEIEKEMKKGLSENPIPDVCKTCYKAYGI